MDMLTVEEFLQLNEAIHTEQNVDNGRNKPFMGEGYGAGTDDTNGSYMNNVYNNGHGRGLGYGTPGDRSNGYEDFFWTPNEISVGTGCGIATGLDIYTNNKRPVRYGYNQETITGIKTINGNKVYYINNIPIIITHVYNKTLAKGYILTGLLKQLPCKITNTGTSFKLYYKGHYIY